MSANIRLTLAYDGTDFCGWQRQKTERTVQAAVEEALQRMLSEPVRVRAAGRTDSGVHATGQVVNFITTAESFPAERWALALNSHLPPDVRALAGGQIGAQHECLAVTFQFQRGASVIMPDLVGVVDPVPGGIFSRRQQIIDRRHGAPSAVFRCMAVGLGVIAAFGMGLQV